MSTIKVDTINEKSTNGAITIANTGNGNTIITPAGSGKVVIDGLTYPHADGSASQVMQTNGSGVLSFSTISAGYTYGTEVANSSATSVEFTSLPSTANQIELFFTGMSFTGTVSATIVIGDAGGYETSGYGGSSNNFESTSQHHVSQSNSLWTMRTGNGAATTFTGVITLKRMDSSKFVYVQSHHVTIDSTTTTHIQGVGHKTLSAVLDRIKISGGTFDGSSTFQVRYQ